ncbi:MAG: type IV secretory system conjugative DNA transfer family protein [Thermoleophilia bacterium]
MTTDEETGDLAGFYLPEEDRTTHVYVLGSSGVGKSKGLANWILEDIKAGNGCGVIDPHGDLVNDIVGNLEDFQRVVLVEMTDPENIIGFNPLEQQDGIDPYTQTLELVDVFRKIWNLSDDTTPRLIEILRNSVLTLIEAGGTMLDIEPLLTNEQFRQEKLKFVTYEAVASFWENRFNKWTENDRVSNIESTLNKVSSFTSDPRIRLMLSAKKSTIDFRKIMDEERAILINLAKGVLRTNSFLLGALFVAKIQMAAMSRVDLRPSDRKPFYFYVDEFQNYATLSFAEIMSEARKYGLSLILAHQSLVQLDQQS